jgi:hypothetical protein
MSRNDQFASWIERFPYDQLVAELDGLQKEVQKLNTRLFALLELKQMYDRIRTMQGSSGDEPQTPAEPQRETVPAKPTLRDSIQTLIASDANREWSTDELWNELTTRGWLRRDDQGKANMFAMLSVMTQQGQANRVKRGVYRAKVSAPDLLEELGVRR